MKLLRRALILITGILILGLFFGYLRQYIKPEQANFLTVFSLLYPFIVIVLVICLLFLVLIRSKWAWAALLAIVLTSGNTIRQIGFHVQPDVPIDSTVYSLTTLNIKNNFQHNKIDQSNAFIKDFITKKPTFLVLQEISGNQLKNVASSLGYDHGSHHDTSVDKGYLATFSKFPLTTVKSIKNAEGRVIALISDITAPEGPLRIINVHLHTNAVTIRAENFTPESFSRKEGLKAFNEMIQSYSTSASLRMDEINQINKEVDQSPHPVIIAGDTNDTPYSPVYLALKGDAQNAFSKGGLGFAQTYNGLIVPLKIDHIFLDNALFIYNTLIDKIDYSDHNPITTSFSFQ